MNKITLSFIFSFFFLGLQAHPQQLDSLAITISLDSLIDAPFSEANVQQYKDLEVAATRVNYKRD